MNGKRLLIVSPTDSRSGAGLFRHALACGLRRAGYTVMLAQPEENGPIQADEAALGIEHHFFSRNPYVDTLAFARDRALAADELQRSGPDVVVFSSGVAPLCHYAFLEAVKNAAIPYLMIEHQVTPRLFAFGPRTTARFTEFYGAASAVVAVSEDNLRTLRQSLALPDRVGRVILNGRPEEFFRPRDETARAAHRRHWGVPEDALVALTVAKLELVKGHGYLIEALRRLKVDKTLSNIFAVWIGDGGKRAALEQDIARAGIGERVRLLGHRIDVAPLYDGGDILVMTSLSEGMPLTVMEGMAKGLPPICTDVGGTAEAIGDAGIVLPPPSADGRTIAELASALRRMNADRAGLDRLSARARQRAVALFREDRMIEEYLDLIAHALARPLPAPAPGVSVAELIKRGIEEHQAGRFQQAEEAYRQVLAVEPAHADALHLLGVVAHQVGRNELAIELIRRAITLNGSNPTYHSNLGVALRDLGRTAEAEASYREAVRLGPNLPDGHSNLGNTLRDLGRPTEAEACYREALRLRADFADAHYGLAMALRAQGRLAEAAASYQEAVRLRPNFPDAFNGLGIALRALGRRGEAEATYREALRLRPDFPDAHNNLGNVLNDLGRLPEAEASYREALRLRLDYFDALNGLGRTLRALGRFAEAETSYRNAVRVRPDSDGAHNGLGTALRRLGRPAEAEASYREALRLRPDFPDAHHGLGIVLRALGRLEEAEASYRKALHLRPDFLDAYNNLGNVLCDLGRGAEAEATFRHALNLRSDFPDAHNGLGAALSSLGRMAESEASYHEALRLRSDFPEARKNLGYTLLRAGRFKEGWEEHEWRWQATPMAGVVRNFAAPLWRGETIGDRVILLHAEQGLGDTLQFCRYVPLVARGARTILEVQAPLMRLLSRLPGIEVFVARGDPLPPFDLHCPLLSLPRAFGTTVETIPAVIPYLAADPALAADWRARLARLDGLRVGLVWAGGENAAIDRRRSIALETLAPLGQVPDVSFVSLQKGGPAAQTAHPPRDMRLHDFTADLHDFDDTAALVVGLDLVISVDTAVAHLAGALGKPVWLLNRFDTCWRWLLNRDDSPWYPLLRQFRQPCPGDWTSVVLAARDALQRLAAGDGNQLRAIRRVVLTP